MKRLLVGVAALSAATAVLISSAGVGAASTPKSWMLSANGTLPSGLTAKVQAAGGTITSSMPELGLAFATSSDASFASKAAKISGIGAVSTNLRVNWLEPEFAYPPMSGDDDTFFDAQWGHIAVDSVGAWNAGFRGNGVKVAVLDTGFNLTHTDLAPNIVGSASMVDAIPGAQWTGAPNAFSHGTHTSGTVAAPDNAFRTIGVAPGADLLLVRVLDDSPGGSGTFEDVIEGIVYAADQDADVINMSLGAVLEKDGVPGEYTRKEAAELEKAISRATTYAFQQGTTVIASAGNDEINFDLDHNLFDLPSMAAHVLSISATAPIGWAKGPGVPFWDGSFDHLASYSNFGKSGVEFAAPGGDASYPGTDICQVGVIINFCFAFDFVLAPGTGGPGVNGFFFAAGTSMAAAHASGVAAIIIGKNGGSMNPAQVEAALKQSADDLGKPGNDEVYGYGRVNAANAVG